MGRELNTDNPEDAIWMSCPDCDVLPGDPCKLDPELANQPGFDKAVHQSRIRSMKAVAEMEVVGV